MKIIAFLKKILGLLVNKATIKIVGIIVIAILIITILGKITGFNILNPFKSKPIIIDKTENVVEEIRQLGELVLTTFYQEGAIVKKKKSLLGDDVLVLIVRGKVRAGFDLSTITSENIVIKDSDILINLLQVKIFDIITNPSDFSIFEESGSWSHEEVTEIMKESRLIVENHAIQSGILQSAEKSAIKELTNLFKSFGFKNVTIDIICPTDY